MRISLSSPLILIIILSVWWISFISIHSKCLEDQRTLLLQLKSEFLFSTKLAQWNQSTDCCLFWAGVTCNKNGHVIGLDLNNESIYGGLDNSSSLFRLQFLQSLNLAYNYFNYFHSSNSPTIPSRFGNLTSLTYLNLSYAGFSGQIPTELLRLTKLVTLDLSTLVYSLLRLENPNLMMLVHNLKELTELRLDGINISSQGYDWCQTISSSLPNLRILSMSNCLLSGRICSSLVKLQFLSEIDLSYNDLTSAIPSFQLSKNLAHLDLSDNNLQGPIPSTHFEGLLNLVYINLRNNAFNATIPPSLIACPSLQKIQLSNNHFSGHLAEFLNASSSLLDTLDLSCNALTGSIPPSFGHLKQLDSLDLSVNKLSGTIPSELASLTFLSFLNLSNNSLVGRIPVGPRLQTFAETSFQGNKGLCGYPLTVRCNEDGGASDLSPPTVEDKHSLPKPENKWDYITAAILGFFVGLGIVVWPLVFCKRWSKWYYKHVDRLLSRIVHQQNKGRQNRRRSTYRNPIQRL